MCRLHIYCHTHISIHPFVFMHKPKRWNSCLNNRVASKYCTINTQRHKSKTLVLVSPDPSGLFWYTALPSGTLKSTKIDKIHKRHAAKIQERAFLREPKRRRQLWHSRKGLGVAWNRLKKHYILQNSRACFFWSRRSAAGSSDTDTQGCETWNR